MNRKPLKNALIFASLFMGFFALARAASQPTDAPDPTALEQERRMKDDAERQAQAICDSILGKNRSSVLVNVELGLETTHKGGSSVNLKRDSKSSLGDDNYILPWVPAPKSVTKEETPKDLSRQNQAAEQSSLDVKTVLKRFDITVVHDDQIPAPRIIMAKEALTSAFDRYANILKLIFKASSFAHDDNYNAKDVLKKNFTGSLDTKTLLYLFLLLLAFMLLRFFFGPLAEFMKSYIEGMKEQQKNKVEMETAAENESENEDENENEGDEEMTPEELAALEAQLAEEEAMKKFEPFTYVTDENIKQLAYLLHHEEPWIIAMVISYLSAEHSFKVMEALPADLQAKVALETAMYRQTSLEQVQAVDEDIKQKIDFVVGGMEKLVVILESSDRMSRDNILEYLKNEKPAVYDRVREKILLFEDIVNFPKLAMQLLVRELKTDQLGKALRNVSPELQQKFFENMSQGAVTLLKEEMEFGRQVTDDQIEEERRKILDLIKTMETEGKIAFRQKGKGGNSMDLSASSAVMSTGTGRGAAQDPAGAADAYTAGLNAQEQGNAEEALRQFELSVTLDPTQAPVQNALANAYYAAGQYQEALASFDAALKLEPNPDLQVWVDQLRASVSAAAA
jgi:flagellar motor switch protein FliG